MKIGIVRYRGRTKYFKDRSAGYLGYDSFAHIMYGQCLWNHVDAAEMEFDAVLFVATPEARKWLIENGRPAGWKKLIYIGYTDYWLINDLDHINDIIKINFDAIAIPHYSSDVYKIFDKPTFYFRIPYDFSNDEDLRQKPKKDKICLAIKNIINPEVDFLNTLYKFKQYNMPGVVTLNPAGPYRAGTDDMIKLVDNLGIKNLTVLPPFDTRREYLEAIADCKLMINMDGRIGLNRNVIDAVTLGMEYDGRFSPMQKYFYSEPMTAEQRIDIANIFSYENVKDYMYSEIEKV